MKLHWSLFAVLLWVTPIVAGENQPITHVKLPELIQVERQLVEYTNTQRARYGLPALQVSASLQSTARRHAAWMTRRQSLVHTSLQVGENIAMGQQSSWEAVRDWMASPGHRANILNGSYRYIGAAAYRSTSGTNYWCVQFLR